VTNPEVRWHLFSEGQSYGPYTAHQLHKFLLGGQATGDTRVCPVGSQKWVLLAEALPQLFQGSPPPAAPEEPLRPPPRSAPRPAHRPVAVVRARLAAYRSYVGVAFLTLLLYWVGFWIIGLVANVIFLSQAKADERMFGEAPPGKGCLTALIWVFWWIPLIFGFMILLGHIGHSVHTRF